MKYKLKRDLPFVKTSPYPQDNEGLQIIELEHKFLVKFTDCNYYIWQTDIPKNNAHLYLEEVKPREWYEVETQRPDGTWSALSYLRYYDKQGARDAVCRCEMNARFIKVREVIE